MVSVRRKPISQLARKSKQVLERALQQQREIRCRVTVRLRVQQHFNQREIPVGRVRWLKQARNGVSNREKKWSLKSSQS